MYGFFGGRNEECREAGNRNGAGSGSAPGMQRSGAGSHAGLAARNESQFKKSSSDALSVACFCSHDCEPCFPGSRSETGVTHESDGYFPLLFWCGSRGWKAPPTRTAAARSGRWYTRCACAGWKWGLTPILHHSSTPCGCPAGCRHTQQPVSPPMLGVISRPWKRAALFFPRFGKTGVFVFQCS